MKSTVKSAPPRTKNSIAAPLEEAVKSFVSFVHSLDAAALAPSRKAQWGVREVLIHLVWWHEQYARQASAAANRQALEPPAGTLKSMNARCVAENLDVPIDKLLSRWRKANRELLALATSESAARISFSLGKKSKAWPLRELVRLAAGHIKRHEAKLRKLLRMRPAPVHHLP